MTENLLDQWSHPGVVCETLEDGSVRCLSCAHRCLIKPGKRGICRVRFNQDGELRVPWGYVAGAAPDPIEKKPFNHFLPGSTAFTFGMLGCNFHCAFCQNWVSSQALRDPTAAKLVNPVTRVRADQLVSTARHYASQVMASSYNEPLISSEWGVEIFKLAHAQGMKTVMVSNGYATPEVLRYVRPFLDGYKVDLKSMNPVNYRDMGGKLDCVLDSIQLAVQLGLWVEVVTLVIPGFNDSSEELWQTSRFLASVSRDIPWHVTAFHPEYKMEDAVPTPASKLLEAAEIGQEAGLNYVYAGNLPGRVGALENTYCPHCATAVIERSGYRLKSYRISSSGNCTVCGNKIPGVWTETPDEIRISNAF
jgi:pyruvate formate lyase activating enzyme